MSHIRTKIKQFVLIACLCVCIFGCTTDRTDGLTRVLILSGRNNHDWKKTTPLLERIYKDSRLFTVKITELPDTLKYSDLKKFDVIVSNWNTWPDNDLLFPEQWIKDFTRYVREGGGAVFIHAGASSFYPWKEYHEIGIGRWGKETHHGNQITGEVVGFNKSHPITKGMRDFFITDEFWEKTDIYPGASPLASVAAKDDKDGHSISENALFVNTTGKGRSFFTTLGHNERALLNTGMKTIILRATQWSARHRVTIPVPEDLKEPDVSPAAYLGWDQTDTTLTLNNSSGKIWQFNFNDRYGKPYFHPVRALNSTLTCVSPPDHPWHLGLWFSWKFINGVNYWEYLDNYKSEETGYRSAGITDIRKTAIFRNPDFSADINMEISYHPADSSIVMTETRNIHISPPFPSGSYYIDHENIFTAVADEVILDRTPIEGEPGGQSWGGYAGLSVRFSEDYSSPLIIVPTASEKYRKNDWLYMGFRTLTGEIAGMCIMQDMRFSTTSASWYVINNPDIPFFYYSPAVLFDGKVVLRKGEELKLRYRIWILPGTTEMEDLAGKYEEFDRKTVIGNR